jgi:hypothetical protein
MKHLIMLFALVTITSSDIKKLINGLDSNNQIILETSVDFNQEYTSHNILKEKKDD